MKQEGHQSNRCFSTKKRPLVKVMHYIPALPPANMTCSTGKRNAPALYNGAQFSWAQSFSAFYQNCIGFQGRFFLGFHLTFVIVKKGSHCIDFPMHLLILLCLLAKARIVGALKKLLSHY